MLFFLFPSPTFPPSSCLCPIYKIPGSCKWPYVYLNMEGSSEAPGAPFVSVVFSYSQSTLEPFINQAKCSYSAEGYTAPHHNECDINSPHKPVGVSKRSTITEEKEKRRSAEMTMDRDRKKSVSHVASNLGSGSSTTLFLHRLYATSVNWLKTEIERRTIEFSDHISYKPKLPCAHSKITSRKADDGHVCTYENRILFLWCFRKLKAPLNAWFLKVNLMAL